MAKKTIKSTKSAKKAAPENLESNQMMAGILSYIGILVLIPLLAIKVQDRDDFMRFHIKQGVILFVVEIIAMIVASIIAIIPILGWLIADLLYLLFLIVSIVAIIKAVQKEQWEIPIISNYTHLVKLK